MAAARISQSSLQSHFSVSHLCTLILQYWALILQQDTCVLTQPLGHLRNSVPENTDAEVGGRRDEQEEFKDINDIHDISQLTDNHRKAWDWARFLLNEERASLRLWESSISNKFLNYGTLDEDGPVGSSEKFLRDAILDSLARIGQALLKATMLGSRGDDPDTTCQVRKELGVMVNVALQITQRTVYQFEGGASTSLTEMCDSERGSIIGDGDPDLFSVLKASIATLQSLSFV
ncbi:hypothetical protein O1611_g6299 [Lasiodiplodia mahajangana]|uniref:Uncharacterized protein n=1 Tax=Lasiodiplodia mahajangana TaxID=1108764 RepID=A0ACC2JIT4_9PEZI|nr:hypothetical protein O1611_g6299 [Lasiodiplodia mahajangana]